MSGSYRGGPSGARGQGGASRAGWGLKAAMDQSWDSFEQRTARPAASTGGDVRAAVLGVLLDGPRGRVGDRPRDRGAQRGRWRPRAGSVYPTLLLLVDEGLATGDGERRQEDLVAHRGRPRRGEARGPQTGADAGDPGRGRPRPAGSIPGAGGQLAQAASRSPAAAPRADRGCGRRPSTRRGGGSSRSSPGADRAAAAPARPARRIAHDRAGTAPGIAASCGSRRGTWSRTGGSSSSCRASASRPSALAVDRARWRRTARNFFGLARELGGLMIKVGQFLSPDSTCCRPR